jgi:hypothetical protein
LLGEETKGFVQASLDFLNVGPRSLTAPLWAAMYAAPLTSIAPLYAVIWVYGPRCGKSTLAHLALAHFGTGFVQEREFHAPRDWLATCAALEGAMHQLEGLPLVIDDFALQEINPAERRRMYHKAEFVVRLVSNRVARHVVGSNLDEQERSPRGLVIATAERPLLGNSVTGRLISLPVKPGDILPGGPALDQAQAQAQGGQYAQAMSLYVAWLSAPVRGEQVETELPQRIEAAAQRIREQYPTLPARLPACYGLLMAAQETALAAFVELGQVAAETAHQIAEANNQAILEATRVQIAQKEAQNVSTLASTLASTGQGSEDETMKSQANARLRPMVVRSLEYQSMCGGLPGRSQWPWFVPVVVFHCTGICRSRYQNLTNPYAGSPTYWDEANQCWDNLFNWAVKYEFEAEQCGLIVRFCLN